ncbi:unknown [Methanothermobacter thermautotrophicus str. Delta H]|uniref:Uncharacterized protein n=1 Tax=Methanothermobacter thermautotrophicus (strain ATCC 29096 / DSM 1053 / JCM 10044 / NBRC 100330 / Delta H) TaxID=187420 RepID=O26726_METTH|nr:unknown [Methanothermobacter thermautotrophicus str. Delta H]
MLDHILTRITPATTIIRPASLVAVMLSSRSSAATITVKMGKAATTGTTTEASPDLRA